MTALLILTSIINCSSFEEAVDRRIAGRLGNSSISTDLIADAFIRAVQVEPEIGAAFRADILAVVERDPASTRLIVPYLYFKGFHAIQTHRLARWLWGKGQTDFALYYICSFKRTFIRQYPSAAASVSTIPPDWSSALIPSYQTSFSLDFRPPCLPSHAGNAKLFGQSRIFRDHFYLVNRRYKQRNIGINRHREKGLRAVAEAARSPTPCSGRHKPGGGAADDPYRARPG